MGCVCSRRFPDEPEPRALDDAYTARRGRYGPGDFDSGELAIPPPKPLPSHKVSETGTFLGRAGIAAVEVLDTLGSSMTSLNHGSGFLSGGTNRGNKVCILAFEVANTIAKASGLWRSCSDESIKELKEEILHSDGVRTLVSTNTSELLHIAAVDKREELAVFSREVIRFGDLCKDPTWHNLGRYFDKYAPEKLMTDNTPQDHSKESMEATVQNLINLAQNTYELYHELHALDRFEQDFKRKFHEEDSVPAARRESIMILHSELKRQRKIVKNLQKKSLWAKTLEEIVEKLVDIVIFLRRQIRDSFNEAVPAGTNFDSEHTQNTRLGPCGLALHYANIINQIENIVSRPLSLPPSSRDNLYHGLPITVKSALRSRLQSHNTEEERTVAQIKAEMQKTLRWLLPIAENTLRAHQGFGWVGEWANLGSDMGKKSGSQQSITRIQTLHHADKAKTEQYILELVVLLHQLVVQVKNRGYGNSKSTKHERSRSKGLINLQPPETQHNTSPVNAAGLASSPLSDCERAALDHMSFRRTSYGRSQSCEPPPDRGSKAHRSWDSCRSQGSSPARECGGRNHPALERDTVRDLDVIDGLDRLTSYSHPSSPTFC
ncbi:unnamed protein product [Urochloa humidicola]